MSPIVRPNFFEKLTIMFFVTVLPLPSLPLPPSNGAGVRAGQGEVSKVE